MRNIRNLVPEVNFNRFAVTIGGIILTTATGYFMTLFSKGGQQADEYLDKKVNSVRKTFETMSTSMFNFAEEMILANTPDEIEPIIATTIAQIKKTSLAYQENGLDIAEQWVDKVEDNFRAQIPDLVKAKHSKEVFKIINKVLKTSSENKDSSLSSFADTVMDILSDKLEQFIETRTVENLQIVVDEVISQIDTQNLDVSLSEKEALKSKLKNTLLENQDRIIDISDATSLSVFLNEVIHDVFHTHTEQHTYNTEDAHGTDVLNIDSQQEEAKTPGEVALENNDL